MDEMVRQRLVGAAVLALLAALILPWLFGNPKDPRSSIQASFSGSPLPAPAATVTPAAQIPPGPRETRAPARPTPRATPRPTPAPTTRPTPAPTAQAAPAPRTPAGPPASGWILQLASYRQPGQADAFLARLHKDGYQAYRESVTIKGKRYHRVRLGLSMSRQEALALQQTLERRYRLQAQLFAAR